MKISENNKYNKNDKLKEECFVHACIIYIIFIKFWCKVAIFITFCFFNFRG